MRLIFIGLGMTATLLLSGCGNLSGTGSADAPVAGMALTGKVHGGQQPVKGAVIQLYAAGPSGDGLAATPLISSTITTDVNGSFTITSTYTCPSASAQVYLVAKGGNPGLSPSTVTNPQLSLMTALGSCGTLSASTFISVNELTTVAAVWSLYPYMTSYSALGSSSSDAASMAAAFLLASEFVDPATGAAPGGTVPTGYSAPVSELNTLANILAGCVNSTGGTASDGSICGNLFAAATPAGGTPPTDIIGAALSIAKHPNQNVTSIFSLEPPAGPFQPTLSSALADWTVPILPTTVNRILFVGDSITHGRYTPVRNYNAASDTDENYGLAPSDPRAESSTEPGPYGGMPGLFAMFASEAGLQYDVHVEAISSTSLQTHWSVAQPVIANTEWNSVVLQEISTRPIPSSLSGTSTSNPNNFCSSVKTIEQGVHAVNPTAKVFLYETWARADEAQALGSSKYLNNLTTLTDAYHNSYYRAAVLDGNIAGVAAVGDAWQLAINDGVVTADPYTSSTGPFLWYGLNAVNNPTITSADELHPSIYGAYLSALVLYGQITGKDPALLGASEQAASALGIGSAIAVQLQQIAHTQIYLGSTAPINQTVDPCSVTN